MYGWFIIVIVISIIVLIMGCLIFFFMWDNGNRSIRYKIIDMKIWWEFDK